MAKQTKIPADNLTESKSVKTKKETKPKAGSTTWPEGEEVTVKKTAAKKASSAGNKDKPTVLTETLPAIVELNAVEPYSRFTDFDIDLFKGGKHYKLYEKLGSHVVEHKGVVGTYFAVWAPNAQFVSVIANFNGWNKTSHPLNYRWDASGFWVGFIPNVGVG
jgi:1,4-alpha-glucan branching enzyme